MTVNNRWVLVFLGAVCVVLISVTFYHIGSKANTRDSLDQLAGQLTKLMDDQSDLKVSMRSLSDQLDLVVSGKDDGLSPQPSNDIEYTFRNKAEAEELIRQLGESPSAEQIAEALTEIDQWLVLPEKEAEFVNYKNSLVKRLQTQVAKEVLSLQREAVGASNGALAVARHAEAGKVLSLFPLEDDKHVLEMAKQLSSKHSESAVRLQTIQRLKYNRWATLQIEEAIKGYYENSRVLKPVGENPLLVESCAKHLREIDPGLLEPAILELYSYALNLTNEAISEKDKIELGKKLTDQTIIRKSLGDL